MLMQKSQRDIPVDERPDIAEPHTQLVAARAELTAAEAELDNLTSVLNPPPSTSGHASFTSELYSLRAHQQLPVARVRFMEAKAVLLELIPRYECTRSLGVMAMTEARNKARLPLLRQFANALEEARVVGEQLAAFDLETVRLGGSSPGHPFAHLLDEPPYREGEATRVSRLVEQLATQ